MTMLKNGPLCFFTEVEYSCPEGWELFRGKCYNVPRECDGHDCYYILEVNREDFWKPENLCHAHSWWPADIEAEEDFNVVENFLNRIVETGHLTANTVWLGDIWYSSEFERWASSKADTGYTWGYEACAELVWSQGWKLRDVPCNSFQSGAVLCTYPMERGITG